MEKRTILAIALSILVFVAFQWYQQRYMPKVEEARKGPDAAERIKPSQPATQAPQQAPPAEAAPGSVSAALATSDTRAQAQSVVVQGDLYKAVIDNKGAVLKSWELTKYESAKGQPYEMIATNHDSGMGSTPSTLIFPNAAVTGLANNELYEVSVDGAAGVGGMLKAPATVTMILRRGDLTIEKKFRFEKDNYVLDISATAQKGGKGLEGRFLLGQDIGPLREHVINPTKLEAVYFLDGKAKRETPPKDENEIKKIGADVQWAGLDVQYFTMLVIPSKPLAYFDIQKIPVKATGADGKPLDRDLLRLTTPINGSLQYRMYLGPKRQQDLESVKGADITGVINYGMFTIIVLPLLSSLRWIYQYVHNYGFAIIILTLLLSILLFPFRLKQMISMKKMQAVQPKVKAIQEKYKKYKKTDPKRAEMNQEIMALYKEHNVNPLGGCLPLLLQFPLLLAFYSLLQYSIELRHAPFIGWLQDLSVKDPYYILPIVMGITMFISQKMTPMTPGADPTQAKMMMVMPVVFTFMFFTVSSGLNLYFLCSNIFQIGFQKITERWIGDGSTARKAKS